MRPICWMALIAALAAFGTQASAQVPLHESRYEMVTTQFDQNISFGTRARNPHQRGWQNYGSRNPSGQVMVLDKRNGQLWSWYESSQTFNYLGQIFPLGNPGSIARVIQVPEQR